MQAKYIYLPVIDSTNNELKRRAEEAVEEFTVISAGQQTGGRGRSGHVWKSPSHDSVSTSMILYPKASVEHVSRLTLIAAMAVAAMAEELYGLSAEIKWPNDVLVHKKKVCGILTEMIPKDGEVGYVIVGIGVNVHQTGFPEDIAAMATSLDLELDGRKASRQTVTESIWTNFLRLYKEFMLTEDLSGILEEYNARLVNVGQEVRILDPLGEYTAISQGIDATGALLVKTGSGEIKRVDSGEVSVRGIYGYV